MKRSIEFFKFTLGNGQSISPGALQALWADACRSPHVSVGRRAQGFGGMDRPVYSLYAPPDLADLQGVEQRLRQLMEQSSLRPALMALHERP